MYEVSDVGTVRNVKTGCELTILQQTNGYCFVNLYKSDKPGGVRVLVHRLVANAFIPNPSNLPEVNHKDEIKQHNASVNLIWSTHQDNVQYSSYKQVGTHGARPIAAYKNGTLVKEYPSIKEASRQVGATDNGTRICGCLHNKRGYLTAYGFTWRYADEMG